MLCAVSLCCGPVAIRMYRKRRAARTMIRSLELKAPSDQQKPQKRAGSKEPAPLQLWTPVSSVDSFCNTSYAAGTVAPAAHCHRKCLKLSFVLQRMLFWACIGVAQVSRPHRLLPFAVDGSSTS